MTEKLCNSICTANFVIRGNPMQLLQNQMYGNTVYFQIQNNRRPIAPAQTQDMPLQFFF
jgi:hypothetical protein